MTGLILVHPQDVETQLIRAAEKFDLAVEILFDHWGDLRPDTRDELIESLRSTAEGARRLAASGPARNFDIDEVLAARLACL